MIINQSIYIVIEKNTPNIEAVDTVRLCLHKQIKINQVGYKDLSEPLLTHFFQKLYQQKNSPLKVFVRINIRLFYTFNTRACIF